MKYTSSNRNWKTTGNAKLRRARMKRREQLDLITVACAIVFFAILYVNKADTCATPEPAVAEVAK